MSTRFSFRLQSADARRDLPHKLLLAQEYDEAPVDILLRLLGYLLFFRERLEVTANLHDDSIPFRPDLVQLDYQLRPVLWVECGGSAVEKFDRLAVKAPEAELWLLQASPEQADALLRAMAKAKLRRNRYHVLAFDAVMIEEMLGLLESRNEVFWVGSGFDPPLLQFEFNGLWFDHEFIVQEF
jgi:uncharacterized protein YaeQ